LSVPKEVSGGEPWFGLSNWGDQPPELLFCLRMTGARIEHSSLGIASFVLSFFPAVLLLVISLMVQYAVSKLPPGTDTEAYGFWMFMLAVWTVLFEIAALGLGIAGTLQRRRKRLFGFLGVVCSVLVLAELLYQVGGPADLASLVGRALTEDRPKVHVVSPGNE
jgi:hypothetical protein